MFRRLRITCLLILALWPNFGFSQLLQQAKPWIGIGIEAGKSGVVVKSVMPDTPAEMTGLKAGDEILTIDTQRVHRPAELINAVQARGVGAVVTLTFIRGTKEEHKSLQLVAKPDELKILRQQLVGKPAPALKVTMITDGGGTHIYDFKGKVTLVELWATWCPACRSTHDQLSQLARQNSGLTVLAISEEDIPIIQKYIDQHKFAFKVAKSENPKALQEEWLAAAIPMLAVIDQEGIVQFATLGAGSYLDEAINVSLKLLASTNKKAK